MMKFCLGHQPSLKLFAIFLLITFISSDTTSSTKNDDNDAEHQLSKRRLTTRRLVGASLSHDLIDRNKNHSIMERNLRVTSPHQSNRIKLKRTFRSIFKDFSRNFRKMKTKQIERGDFGRGLKEAPAFFNVSATPQINTSKISVLNFAAPDAPDANEIREKDRSPQQQVLNSQVTTQYGLLKRKRV